MIHISVKIFFEIFICGLRFDFLSPNLTTGIKSRPHRGVGDLVDDDGDDDDDDEDDIVVGSIDL